jgi:hypothetical protein
MKYHTFIDINEGRINYELKEYGSAVVGVPSSSSEDEVTDALNQLRAKYDHVEVDIDGDLIISEK